jgi:hypothetical protein
LLKRGNKEQHALYLHLDALASQVLAMELIDHRQRLGICQHWIPLRMKQRSAKSKIQLFWCLRSRTHVPSIIAGNIFYNLHS